MISLVNSRGPCRLKVVQHQVDYHAGDAYVEPDGEGPAGDAAVGVVARGPAAAERHYGQHGDGGGQERVGSEDAQVECLEGAGSLKPHAAYLIVIDEVTHQEQARDYERGLHHFAMLGDASSANQRVAPDQEHGGGGVQGGVHGGEDGGHDFSRSSWRISW